MIGKFFFRGRSTELFVISLLDLSVQVFTSGASCMTFLCVPCVLLRLFCFRLPFVLFVPLCGYSWLLPHSGFFPSPTAFDPYTMAQWVRSTGEAVTSTTI